MYCTKCGKRSNPKNMFCSECGQKKNVSEPVLDKEQVPQPQNGIEIPDTQSESNQTADKKTLRPNVSIRLLLSIATVLLIVGVIGLWYWNSDKTPSIYR